MIIYDNSFINYGFLPDYLFKKDGWDDALSGSIRNRNLDGDGYYLRFIRRDRINQILIYINGS